MTSELRINQEKIDGYIKIALSGEVDIYTSQQLKDMLYKILDDEGLDLVIDCSELNYIDSTGLGIFVGALKKAGQYNKKISMTNLKENIRKLFIITGLDKVFVLK